MAKERCGWGGVIYLVSDVVVQHADDRRAFAVGDGVEDLVHFRRVADVHLHAAQATLRGTQYGTVSSIITLLYSYRSFKVFKEKVGG